MPRCPLGRPGLGKTGPGQPVRGDHRCRPLPPARATRRHQRPGPGVPRGGRIVNHTWDPDRYLTYADERGRPFVDLIARIAAADPRAVVDLGCGPGNLTALLAARWPDATVTGVDSSA